MSNYKYVDEKGEHLHLLNDKPLFGTSTVTQVIAKPLTWWSAGLAVKVFSGIEDCKVLTKIKNKKATEEEVKSVHTAVGIWLETHKDITTEDYIKICQDAYKAHSVKLADSAEAGIDLHAELERFVKNHMICNDPKNIGGKMKDTTVYDSKIQPFIDWTEKNIKRFLWSEIHAYSERMWTGGISDMGYEKNDGVCGIMDFKSAKDAYMSHFIQIAGYDLEISENGGYDAEGNKVFELDKPITEYAVLPFGMENPVPQFYYNTKGAKEGFEACLVLHRLLNV